MKRILVLFLVFIVCISILSAADSKEDLHWALGISSIAPVLPVGLKIVYQKGDWGWQGEANYYYLAGALRLDGRRVLKGSAGTDIYGFAGVTMNHFNGFNTEHPYLEFILSADVGAGAEWRFSNRFGVGVEGGLLIPFWCNRGLDQFDDSGLMVANIYGLYWF